LFIYLRAFILLKVRALLNRDDHDHARDRLDDVHDHHVCHGAHRESHRDHDARDGQLL
jgi:hypothetical protein